jgi:hypothetical protein
MWPVCSQYCSNSHKREQQPGQRDHGREVRLMQQVFRHVQAIAGEAPGQTRRN